MVAMGKPRGGQGMPKGAQDDPKESQRDPKGTPETPQRQAWDALEQPWGDPGAAWGDYPKNEGGDSIFPAQKWTGFWRPQNRFFIVFATNFRIDFSLSFDAVFVAKLASKSRPKGCQGCQIPGQGLP